MYFNLVIGTFNALLFNFVTPTNITVFSHVVRAGEPLMLPGCVSNQSNPKWKHRGIIISFRHEILNHKFKNNSIVYLNYSLLLENVRLFNEGIFECGHDSSVEAKHILRVQGLILFIDFGHISL